MSENESKERNGAERKRDDEAFPETILRKQKRKLKAERNSDRGLWFGLGMFGLVGWSVAIPTVIGVFIGIWMDSKWPGRPSWTLTMLLVGVVVGCLNAWFWVKRESRKED